ncbi:MAG TPA: enoyl-CoA hydratase/isomerase family protein [Actinomycetota bacterium]|jgi:enoyl-CoA hydratase/carnithine racemase|nr:enoyl-CoA hydratase/isomerase family protein [Actinomycetota bacterium]
MSARIRYEVQGQVARITLARPEKLNAMDRQAFHELEEAAVRAAADPGVRSVLVSGEGRAFSSGLDVAEFGAARDLDLAEELVSELQRATAALERMPKPVVAAVNGLAMGGGLQLAIACDLRLASEQAQFAALEMRWAIVPDLGGTERLPRLIGLGRAKEMILTGRPVTAAEAERIGLVNRVVPAERLAGEAAELAAGLAAGPTLALGLAKQALNEAFERSAAEGMAAARRAQRRTFASDDHAEARAAFAERRPPRFSGR